MKAFKKMAAVTAAMTILLSANMTVFPNNLTSQFAITASAADIVDSGTCGAQGDNLTWTLDSSGILTISGIGEMKNWKSYDSPWGFREEIKKVVIEEGVTSIGYSAFYHCSGITSISFPKSVAAISMEAFEKTQWLENQLDAGPFVIVNGILIDGRYCEGSVTTPGGVHSIGEGAFFWNGDITSIKIADGVTSIGASAFSQCNYLKTVTLPNSLRTIETYAFQKCNQLRTITIPNGIKQIASYAFIDCPSLTEIALPSSIASIGKGAFFKCNSLSSVTIKNADCEIEDSEGTIPQTATIYGYDDSTAQRYAKKNDIDFVSLGEAPPTNKTGDITGDGAIDAADAQLALNAYTAAVAGLASGLNDSQTKAADVNEDNNISVEDAQMILLYYVQNTVSGIPTTWEELLK